MESGGGKKKCRGGESLEKVKKLCRSDDFLEILKQVKLITCESLLFKCKEFLVTQAFVLGVAPLLSQLRLPQCVAETH